MNGIPLGDETDIIQSIWYVALLRIDIELNVEYFQYIPFRSEIPKNKQI